MPARYFFHAPDGRIYGPASLETLRRWETEGRLRPDSRLRAEGVDDLFHAWSELRDRVETPEAALSAAAEEPPPLPAAPPLAPVLLPPTPLFELAREALLLARAAWRPLWFLGLLFLLPRFAAASLAPSLFHLKIDFNAGVFSMDRAGYAAACAVGVLLLLCSSFLVLPLRDLREGRPVSLARSWGEFAPLAGGLLWTYLLTACILAAWGMLTLLLFSAVFFVHGLVKGLVTVTALLSVVPTLLLTLRCLVLPQAAILERRRGLSALRRAIEVIRFSPRNTLFSLGDFRALVLGALSLFVVPLLVAVVASLPLFLPLPDRLGAVLAEVLELMGSIFSLLFVVSLFLAFFEDARRRFRAAGGE